MAETNFSGPVVCGNGFKYTPILTADLPAASAANEGQSLMISDNGAGDNEYAIVVSTGSAWVTADGNALD